MLAESVPDTLQTWLESWAGRLWAEVEAAVFEARCHVLRTQPKAQSPSPPPVLLVGTDCSGLEAPVHALSALKVKHTQCWASEIAEAPRQMILVNAKPRHLFDSVLAGSMQNAPYVHMYISGFSCKPFSTLHRRTGEVQQTHRQEEAASLGFEGVAFQLSS